MSFFEAATPRPIPVDEYTHPEGARVTLVGVVHFAPLEYFEALQEELNWREGNGAAIHHEGILITPDDVLAAAPDEHSQKALRLRRLLHRTEEVMGQVPGLVSQREGLTWGESWENRDATDLDVGSRLGNGFLAEWERRAEAFAAGLQTDDVETKWRLMQDLLSSPAVRAEGEPDPSEVIIDYRNGVALAGADEHSAEHPGTELVLPWGKAHMLGLAEGLTARGYRRTGLLDIVFSVRD